MTRQVLACCLYQKNHLVKKLPTYSFERSSSAATERLGHPSSSVLWSLCIPQCSISQSHVQLCYCRDQLDQHDGIIAQT